MVFFRSQFNFKLLHSVLALCVLICSSAHYADECPRDPSLLVEFGFSHPDHATHRSLIPYFGGFESFIPVEAAYDPIDMKIYCRYVDIINPDSFLYAYKGFVIAPRSWTSNWRWNYRHHKMICTNVASGECCWGEGSVVYEFNGLKTPQRIEPQEPSTTMYSAPDTELNSHQLKKVGTVMKFLKKLFS